MIQLFVGKKRRTEERLSRFSGSEVLKMGEENRERTFA